MPPRNYQSWTDRTTCPHCGEYLTVPRIWHSVVPPRPSCPNHCEEHAAKQQLRPQPQPKPARPTQTLPGPALTLTAEELERLREMHRRGDG